jgi:ABC-type multidrug transport system ATPase subunit
MAPAVSLRSAVALLGTVPAIAGVDLDVDEGAIVGALGPNGAGKTSLLLVIAGLLALRKGTGTVLGLDLTADRRAVRRHVGLLGHHLMGYPELSATENVEYGLRAQRRDVHEATGALERVGLVGRMATVPARMLSAGQQRRMGLAWLLARRPEIWLLDEPHAGLDEAGRTLCDEVVVEAAGHGATVILTSHDRDRAARVADELVELAGGVVVSTRRGQRVLHVA